MRGRIINPFLVEIAQLDTGVTEASGGYDPIFRETLLVSADNERGAVDARAEREGLDLKCQIEPELLNQLQMMMSGNSPKQTLSVVAHFRDLENAGLVDASGLAMLRKGDRLVAVKDLSGAYIQQIPTPPGLYLTEIRYMGFGIGRKRNLLFLRFEERENAARSQGG